MIKYDVKTGLIKRTAGGYLDAGLPIHDQYVTLEKGMQQMRCVMYEPIAPVEKSQIAVIIFHSDEDYSTFNIGGELAKRGYRTLCGQVSSPSASLDDKLLDIKHAIKFMKSIDGVKKIVLMGHSGGATLMSAYQGAAEKGVAAYKAENILYKCKLNEELIPADAMLILDSNWGNGAMTLFSVDPAVVEEGNGIKLDPELDIFNPANGFNPNGSTYSDSFIKKFYAAQGERNNAIVKRALDRLALIEQGKGNYIDDEPFVVTASNQLAMINKLFPQDIRLLNHTKEPHTLLHKDGSATTEIVHSVRSSRGGHQPTPSIFSCCITTVRSYLSNRAVLAGDNYIITPDGVEGIQWDNTYNCTSGNVKNITVPMLVMGMTGSYEYLAAEVIYNNSGSSDKSIAFVEGAGHSFDTHGPGSEKYGDTQKVLFDYVDKWMSESGRLL